MSGGNLEKVRSLEWKLQLNGIQILTFAGIAIASWHVSSEDWFLLPLGALIVRSIQAVLYMRQYRKLLGSWRRS